MKLRRVSIALLNIILCVSISACSLTNQDKPVYAVSDDNATQICYQGTTYQISATSLESDELGGWIGIIKEAVVLDTDLNILKQEKLGTSLNDTVNAIKKDPPANAYLIVPFQNVYAVKDSDHKDTIVIGISNNYFYKAVAISKGSENIASIDVTQAKGISFIDGQS